jgi:DNA-binding protein HU-beta
MNKQELINTIQQSTNGASKATVETVLDTLGSVVQSALKKGDEVTLPGLGKLSVSKRAARIGRNPATGAELKIKAKKVPKFSAAKALKDAVA